MNDKVTAPRRRVEMLAKISADSWRDLQHHLHGLATEIATDGKLSSMSISGGCSSGHIISTSDDGSITHDSWAADLERYLDKLKSEEGEHPPLSNLSDG